MKKTRVLLQMILLAAFARGASLGAQSGLAQERIVARSDERSSNSSRAGSSELKARGEKDQTTGYSRTNETHKISAAPKASTRIPRPAASQAKPPQYRPLHSAKTSVAKGIQAPAPQNIPSVHQINPTWSTSVSGKTVRQSSRPASLSTVAVNGQRFKNSRDPGARMATIGGTANSARGAAAINGSDVKRKP